MITTYTANLFLAVFICTIVNFIQPVIEKELPAVRTSIHAVLNNSVDYDILAETIAGEILAGRQIDEITIGEKTLVFDCKITSDLERVYTGVEFMGDKEQYIQTKYKLKSITLTGTYNQNGDELQTDIDIGKLQSQISKLL